MESGPGHATSECLTRLNPKWVVLKIAAMEFEGGPWQSALSLMCARVALVCEAHMAA